MEIHRGICIAIILIFTNTLVAGQDIISTTGNYNKNSYSSISWTMGEPIIETFNSANNIITQGFQQNTLAVVSIYELQDNNTAINVFPNPVNKFVYINTEKFTGLSFKLFDTNGKLLYTGNLYQNQTKILFNKYASGIYFLHIEKQEQLIQNFQIIKY